MTSRQLDLAAGHNVQAFAVHRYNVWKQRWKITDANPGGCFDREVQTAGTATPHHLSVIQAAYGGMVVGSTRGRCRVCVGSQ